MSARSLPRPGRGPDLATARARLAAAARAAAYYGYARPRRRAAQLAGEGRRRWAERAYRPRWAAVQGHGEYASVRGIAGDCLRLRTGEYRAVLEVAGVGWRRLPEEEQDALVDAHGWALPSGPCNGRREARGRDRDRVCDGRDGRTGHPDHRCHRGLSNVVARELAKQGAGA